MTQQRCCTGRQGLVQPDPQNACQAPALGAETTKAAYPDATTRELRDLARLCADCAAMERILQLEGDGPVHAGPAYDVERAADTATQPAAPRDPLEALWQARAVLADRLPGDRDWEIIEHRLAGRTVKDIGILLGVSRRTVTRHLADLRVEGERFIEALDKVKHERVGMLSEEHQQRIRDAAAGEAPEYWLGDLDPEPDSPAWHWWQLLSEAALHLDHPREIQLVHHYDGPRARVRRHRARCVVCGRFLATRRTGRPPSHCPRPRTCRQRVYRARQRTRE